MHQASFSDSSSQQGFSRRSFLAVMAGTSLLAPNLQNLFAAGPNQADTSEQARSEAEQAIPFDKLRADTKAKILSVVDRPSLYRRLPNQVVDCDHELHVFLTRYPEVVVNIWQLMGITSINVKRTAEFTVDMSDGAGTVSRVDLVYGTPDMHLFYCTGEYEGPLFKRKLTGRSVVLLRSAFQYDRNRRPVVTDRMDVFLTVDNAGAELIAKTLQSTVGKTVDANFQETAKFIARINDSTERNGPGMQNLAGKLNSCEEGVRTQFATVCNNANDRSAQRLASLTSAPVTASAESPLRTSPGATPRR